MNKTQTAASGIFTPQALLEHWQGHRRITRRMIEAFPEDKLFYHSIGGMRPFAELVYEFLGMTVPGITGIATGKWQQWTDAEKVTTKKRVANSLGRGYRKTQQYMADYSTATF